MRYILVSGVHTEVTKVDLRIVRTRLNEVGKIVIEILERRPEFQGVDNWSWARLARKLEEDGFVEGVLKKSGKDYRSPVRKLLGNKWLSKEGEAPPNAFVPWFAKTYNLTDYEYANLTEAMMRAAMPPPRQHEEGQD